MAIQPGTDIGRYHILEKLGEGGMAVVYKAYDTRLENEVAVKFIRVGSLPPDALPRIQKRFQIEAKKMARLMHPNIVNVMDYGDHEGAPYLVMPFLPGGTLKDFLGKPMQVDEAVRILLPIADALGYAHAKGLVHRDIKPANILITETGKPMLSDFGIAKVLVSEETLDLTTTGMGVGTPEYMAPEQASGSTFDHRADIYSLGIVLYEMVTGRKPFTADTPMAVVIKQATDPLPRPTAYNPDLSPEVEQVLFKALAKHPNARYEDMSVFAAALEKLSRIESVVANQEPARPDKEKLSGEKLTQVKKEKKPFDTRWLIAGLGALGLGLMIFAGMKMFGGELPKTENVTLTDTEAVTTAAEIPLSVSPESGAIMVSEKDGMTLVYVPARDFQMGSEDGEINENPIHAVYEDAFWIDQTEVTNAQYQQCTNDGICDPPLETDHYEQNEYSDHPVAYVNWYAAQEYCQWAGRRLPTEAEWEKAAHGTFSRIYPWGEDIDCGNANYEGCGDFPSTSPVGFYGEKGVSPYGIFDMGGNVWEWTSDWYESDYYAASPSNNPTGPESGNKKVLRGGSWSRYEWFVRSTYRHNFMPEASNNSIGFRCVMDAD